jgi:cytochrome b561
VNNRVAFLVCLDTAMFLLVCVLETIKFTGLEWHQWLGFALCPLVLLHVVLQWPWFTTQFQNMGRRGGYRVRFSALLNVALFVLMAAVLFSGIFASRQSTALIAESLGHVRIWHEVHGWLNFILVVFVGLHLALNWDWILTALRRCRPRQPALAAMPPSDAATERRSLSFGKSLGRGLIVLLLASLATSAVYFTMKATMLRSKKHQLMNQPTITATAKPPDKKDLAPRPRAALGWHGIDSFAAVLAITLLVAIIGRYVFRLRL